MIKSLLTSTAIAALLMTSAMAQDAAPATPAPSGTTAPADTTTPAAPAEPAAPADTTTPAAPAADATAANPAPSTSILATGYTVTDKQNLASEIMGKQVYSSTAADAEHIGDVNNLVIGENGEVAAVIIGVGGFLGLGQKNVAVNYSELEWVVADDNTERFVLPTTREALEAAPDFQTTEEANAAAPMAPAGDTTPAPADGAMAPADNTMAPAAPAN